MSVEFTCGDPAGLAGYLYGECDDRERTAIAAHLAGCPECAEELVALGATRTALASWTPPDAVLGFRLTSAQGDSDKPNGGVVLRPAPWWRRPLPAWAQAAAAVAVFAAGMTLGARSGELQPPAAPTGGIAPASSVSANDLSELEQRLRAEMAALRSSAPTVRTDAAARPHGASDEAVIQRVRSLITESEQRQQRELAVRMTQVLRDVDAQRRVDLMRIEQTFGQMEGFTRPELADQRQMLNYLIQRTGMQRAPQ